MTRDDYYVMKMRQLQLLKYRRDQFQKQINATEQELSQLSEEERAKFEHLANNNNDIQRR